MLTSKQRAYLRSLANPLPTIGQIGKDGITESVIQSAADALAAREIIKLRVLENSEYTPREAAEEIAEATNSEVVTVIGTKFVLYRESEKHKKIFLD